MRADLLIVQICEFLDNGDGIYRLHAPSRALARLPGVVVIDCHFSHRLLPRLLQTAHVMILPFVRDWDILPALAARRSASLATVFEANDDFTDVPPWSPAARQWRDPSVQAAYRHTMAQCDAVQTSTPTLAELWRPLARRVAVFPNHLPDVPPLRDLPARPLTIGWGGSPGHLADWYAVAPTLQRWLAAHPQVRLAVMTNAIAKPFFDLPAARYRFAPFGSLASYLTFLQSLDIGLAPLLPTAYNRGRSDVKFLEYAAHGVAGIYARLEPYADSVEDGRTGLLYETDQELVDKLDLLARDGGLRARLRDAAYREVADHRRLDQHIGERLAFYRELLPAPPQPVELPAELLAAAVVDGNYLCLRPGEAERAVLTATATAETAAALSAVIGRFPDYQAALLRQGRLLNDAKRPADARVVLQRARDLQPASAAAGCELARSHYLLGDEDAAFACFQAALERNPAFHPGWGYLLRFLAVTGRAQGPDWAARARELFPEDTGMALLAIAVFPPDQQVDMLLELLESSLRPDPDDVLSLAQFSAAVVAAGKADSSASAWPLVQRACEIYPHSARLADLAGQTLQERGDLDAAAGHFRRALVLRRAARAYAAEFAQQDATYQRWQMVEHIRRHRPPAD